MAFRTNYRFERAERDRLKKAKKDEKLKRQQERAASRADDSTTEQTEGKEVPEDLVRAHRGGRGPSLGQSLRLTFVHSVWISPGPPDHRHDDADDEHDHQEQRDLPSPRDWRNRNNRYPQPDHTQADNRIIAIIDAGLFAQPPKRLVDENVTPFYLSACRLTLWLCFI